MRILGSFDEALQHAVRFRPQLPVSYNPSREHELPIPVVPIPNDLVATNEELELDDELEDQVFFDANHNNETQQQTYEEESDVKPIFDVVPVEEADVNAFDTLFTEESEPNGKNDTENILEDPLANISSLSIEDETVSISPNAEIAVAVATNVAIESNKTLDSRASSTGENSNNAFGSGDSL